MQRIKEYHNVFYDGESVYKFTSLNEHKYLLNVFSRLETMMADKFMDFDFYIYSTDTPKRRPESSNFHSSNKKILIMISDESSYLPTDYAFEYTLVFKSYFNPTKTQNTENIYPFPLGFVKNVPAVFPTLISGRKHDVFFSGSLHKNRIAFYRELSGAGIFSLSMLKSVTGPSFMKKALLDVYGEDFSDEFYNSFIRFNRNEGFGLSAKYYGTMLGQTKIVLCPPGVHSSETHEIYEALRAGCVVISEKLPATNLYKKSPIQQIDDWEEGLSLARSLLADPKKLAKLQEKSIKWYDRVFSEKAAAQFISFMILNLK